MKTTSPYLKPEQMVAVKMWACFFGGWFLGLLVTPITLVLAS